MEYVPRGYLSVPQALESLVRLKFGELLDGAPDRANEKRRLNQLKGLSKPAPIMPITERDRPRPHHHRDFKPEEAARLLEIWDIERKLVEAHEACATDLRTALAEGDLMACLMTNDGRELAVPKKRWRDEDGLSAVFSGRLRLVLESSPADGIPCIKEGDFNRWAEPIAPRHLAPSEVRTWMLNYAREVKRTTGKKPFRDCAIEECIRDTGCGTRNASDAFKALPSDLKRSARESSRVKTGKTPTNG